MIPHSRPTLGPEDAEALLRVLSRGHLSQGPEVSAFEEALARRVDRPAAVAASSGTAALGLALAALRAGKGDEILLPAYGCAALTDAVRFAGATPVLSDVGTDLALSPIEGRRRLSRRTAAIVVVHPFGLPVDLDPFLEWGLPVVEDCAQALGAFYRGRPVGSFGTVSVFSFYATKMVAAGEGGILAASSGSLLDTARRMRLGGSHEPGSFNHKLSDLAASLGLAQLGRLDEFVAHRRKIAERYDADLAGTAVRTIPAENGAEPCCSRYVVCVPDARALIAALGRRGVEARPAITDPLVCGEDAEVYPEAARAAAECVSLPIYPSLEDFELEYVVKSVLDSLIELGWRR